jgi:hypothetical protein
MPSLGPQKPDPAKHLFLLSVAHVLLAAPGASGASVPAKKTTGHSTSVQISCSGARGHVSAPAVDRDWSPETGMDGQSMARYEVQ